MLRQFLQLLLLLCVWSATAQQPTNEEIRAISSQIWAADSNRITGDDLQYDPNGPKLFTYVNEDRFTGTWARLIALFDNFIPETGIAESCGTQCREEEEAFLDAIVDTSPIRLLHEWLAARGLANSSTSEFKNDLRQYWFMRYTRSSGPLDSSGFEHVFVGEIKNNAVSGSHNWVSIYYKEKEGDLIYGPPLDVCEPENVKFSFVWLGYKKEISSAFMGTSPEVEIALGTLCLLTRIGGNCPVQLGDVQATMTAWDMTGLPKTIGTAYPNC